MDGLSSCKELDGLPNGEKEMYYHPRLMVQFGKKNNKPLKKHKKKSVELRVANIKYSHCWKCLFCHDEIFTKRVMYRC